jgi:hypothetical protein
MRRKIFGMICVPLDRNAKARLLHRARCLMRATEKGRHYGQVTAKAYAIFAALLMSFHNGQSGRCFPSYKRIAEAAGCCERTVADAIAALEATGLLGVANRLIRVRWRDELALAGRVRVMRTSNCYTFPSGEARNLPVAAQPSKGNLSRGTETQFSNPDLFVALDRLQEALRGRAGPPARA